MAKYNVTITRKSVSYYDYEVESQKLVDSRQYR